jgi:single-stranded DNA-specific DHH superfamily exonuclease
MINDKQLAKIRDDLEISKNPLYFFHDDPDGLSSFLLFYRFVKEGHGIIIKTHPLIDEKFLKKVEEYHPDKIFIVDIAKVKQEFIDRTNVPIIWIDHHGPQDRDKVYYANPRINDPNNNTSVSEICYDVVKQDLWIAMCGIIGDWQYSDKYIEFSRKYPDLLSKDCKDPRIAYYESKIGKLVKIFSFLLKGPTHQAMKNVKIMTRIESPYEILNQTTSRGKWIYRNYEKINVQYEELLQEATKSVTKDKIMVFTYPDNKMSFTGDLSNELLYKYPDKVIIVAREKSGEMKASVRSPPDIIINDKIEKALIGTIGYGGGHEHACGVVIKSEEWKTFLTNFKNLIK